MTRDLSGRLLVLDTNIVVHLTRGNEFGRSLDQAYGLRARSERPLISRVTVGELLSLADQFRWGQPKRARLMELVRELVVVEIGAEAITDAWARFHTFLRTRGRVVSDNDLWIAATASAAGAVLLTTDKDCGALVDEGWLDWIYIDPPGGAAPGP